jgi:hypothetical protein
MPLETAAPRSIASRRSVGEEAMKLDPDGPEGNAADD